jgi:glucoside 3-dehydrogenase (cytochrome c) hitch-hiker subunit
MNRREVLKGLALSLGYVVATPAVISILQSCKNDVQKTSWKPQFFSEDEDIVIRNLVNLILPKTENLPGAEDVNVAQFIDAYTDKVVNKKEQDRYKKGITAIIISLNKPVKKLTSDDYDAILSKFLKAKNKEIERFKNNENDTLILEILKWLRGMTIWTYKNSQLIGEEVLAYDPIPVIQLGCISLEEATGGKAWSL